MATWRSKGRTGAASFLATAGGLLAGSALMYFFDPRAGRRRRALARDRALGALRRLARAARVTQLDLAHQARGVAHDAKARLLARGPVPDDVLVARVRSKLGRCVSHPRAIQVTAADGRVTLEGPVLAAEVDDLLAGVRDVRGVLDLEDRLDVHEQATHPALEGGGRPPGIEPWRLPPGNRFLLGLAGFGVAALGAAAARRRTLLGGAFGIAGLGVAARALANRSAAELLGIGPLRGVAVQKTIRVDAPVEAVFELFTELEGFPLFMERVRSVEPVDDAAYRFVVSGPFGIPVSWEAVITQVVDNELIAWESVEGSTVENWGRVRFEADPAGGTRVDVNLHYNPPLGVLGHAVARALGSDAKADLDVDLKRMKGLLETGVETDVGLDVETET